MTSSNRKVRLRFAPSPTGSLHIGGARTALFNWAYARRHGGRFILRIEDTDRERSTPEHEAAVLEGMRWLGIDWDEGPDVGGDFGPYRQTERFDSYAELAERMVADGTAYRAFDSTEEIQAMRETWMHSGQKPVYQGRDLDPEESARRAESDPFVLRFRVPEGTTRFTDMIRGEVSFDNGEVDDWVMVRSDGTPTYNFVVVCDDTSMEISHVMRGEEHLTNTPKQVLLYEALGLEPPSFGHFPLILGKDKKKLSKRTGDTAVQSYREKGYPPEAVLNFLCLQGWALDDKTEIFSVQDLIGHFDPADVSKGGSIFDPEKFLWLAGEYVRASEVGDLAERCLPYVVAAGLATEADLRERRDWFERAVATEQERIRLYADLPARIAYLFARDGEVVYDPQAEKNARKHADRLDTLKDYLAWLEPHLQAGSPAEEVRARTRDWVGERGLKFPQLFQPLRCALTGAAGGPDLFDVMELLGPQAVRKRLQAAAERLA